MSKMESMSKMSPVPLSAVCSARRPLIRTSRFAKEGRRCRTTRGDAWHATSRVHSRSPRVMRVPIHAAARGEAPRTRHRRGLRRRRGASPECSVSAGLHPSPGTVHPRRQQHGGGDGENIGTPQTLAQMKMRHTAIQFSFPLVRAQLSCGIPMNTQVTALFRPDSAVYSQLRGLPEGRRPTRRRPRCWR
jgi:hypothetical protein